MVAVGCPHDGVDGDDAVRMHTPAHTRTQREKEIECARISSGY